MRLYLSSFRVGNAPEKLVGLMNGNMRAGVIANSCDLYPGETRDPLLNQEVQTLNDLGFSAKPMDLRDFFQAPCELETLLTGFDLIWVRGGNPFVLRRAMRASGFDRAVVKLLERDLVVWGGYSAGVAVLGPSLKGIELVDDPHEVPPGYDPAIIWDGLDIIHYTVAPHYKSPHPESAAIDNTVQYLIDNRILFKVLRDGEAIVINGDKEEIAGYPTA